MANLIGQRIKQKREELKMTQKEVAERLFVTQQTVARWEKNRHEPPIKAIRDLAVLFDVETSYFFEEDQITTWKFNLLAFVGSLIVNFMFFWIIAVVLVSFLCAFWGATLGSLVAPLVAIWQFNSGIHAFGMFRMGAAIGMSVVSFILIPYLWKITGYIGHILKAYYRYNVDSFIYEVVPPKEKDDDDER